MPLYDENDSNREPYLQEEEEEANEESEEGIQKQYFPNENNDQKNNKIHEQEIDALVSEYENDYDKKLKLMLIILFIIKYYKLIMSDTKAKGANKLIDEKKLNKMLYLLNTSIEKLKNFLNRDNQFFLPLPWGPVSFEVYDVISQFIQDGLLTEEQVYFEESKYRGALDLTQKGERFLSNHRLPPGLVVLLIKNIKKMDLLNISIIGKLKYYGDCTNRDYINKYPIDFVLITYDIWRRIIILWKNPELAFLINETIYVYIGITKNNYYTSVKDIFTSVPIDNEKLYKSLLSILNKKTMPDPYVLIKIQNNLLETIFEFGNITHDQISSIFINDLTILKNPEVLNQQLVVLIHAGSIEKKDKIYNITNHGREVVLKRKDTMILAKDFKRN